MKNPLPSYLGVIMGHFILQFLHTYSYADPVLIVPERSSQHLLENQKQTATKQQHQQRRRRRRGNSSIQYDIISKYD